jgi:hypothetical protein
VQEQVHDQVQVQDQVSTAEGGISAENRKQAKKSAKHFN